MDKTGIQKRIGIVRKQMVEQGEYWTGTTWEEVLRTRFGTLVDSLQSQDILEIDSRLIAVEDTLNLMNEQIQRSENEG